MLYTLLSFPKVGNIFYLNEVHILSKLVRYSELTYIVDCMLAGWLAAFSPKELAHFHLSTSPVIARLYSLTKSLLAAAGAPRNQAQVTLKPLEQLS